ncbi:type II secretion system protein [Spirochaetes bacterium]|uniref:Type II secretion system protein n=1 Tax=Candidatus Scatousia excrementipullorum TaxID=2840936 RepID=A0A9D9DM41_9BACT|nr:type II secretion system protein [Candidatus Scatousia excrementipullorum]
MPEGFSAYSAGTRKAAFTLAEVLITLGIIGVVAAMTLPSLVNKYREQEIITRVKKTYTSIAQALELVQANYGTPGDNSSLFAKGRSSAEITKELSKYFNGARYCEAGANAKGCKNLNYKIKYASLLQSGATGAQMTNMTGYPRIVLNNGVVLAIGTKNSDCADYVVSGNSYNSDGSIKKNPDGTTATWTQTRNNCGIVVFDVNGSRRPNQFGYDAYQINVFKNKIGKDYWGAMGTSSLDNILSGKKNPLVYTDYDENGEFEW